jgi:hypothetical protein
MNYQILNFLLFAVLFIKISHQSHYRGGTITARPIESTPNEVKMEFTLSFAWRLDFNKNHFCDQKTIDNNGLIGDDKTFECRKYNGTTCKQVISRTTVYCKFFSPTNGGDNWSYGKRVFNYTLGRVKDFEASFIGSAWIALVVGGSGDWEVRLKLDTTNRKDTGVINTTPISTIPPIVTVRKGIKSTIPITWADPDSTDVIRCRWAEDKLGECGKACKTVPPATLNETTCILTFDGTQSKVGYYGATIQLEDFQNSNDNTPMSSVPVQFLIHVVESESNCTEPPIFIDTRPASSCNSAPLNELYTERFTAQSQCPNETIASITVIGLVGSRVSDLIAVPDKTNEKYVDLTWKPTTEQEGPNVVCAVATDSSFLAAFNCFTIIVGKSQAPKPIKLGPVGLVLVSNKKISWSITFDQPIERPEKSAFIKFYNSEDQLVYQIDTSLSQEVTFDNYTLSFETSHKFDNNSHYVLFDHGIVRGTSFCKISSEPVKNTDAWNFVPEPELLGCNKGGSFSCQNGGKCLEGGSCVCFPGFSGFLCENCMISLDVLFLYSKV